MTAKINTANVGGKGGNNAAKAAKFDKTLKGTAGADVQKGGRGNDKLVGKGGNDIQKGGRGADHLKGGKGNDIQKGGKGNDFIQGGRGNDIQGGGRGSDFIKGGKGSDFIQGGRGNDTLKGGAGNDFIKGGKGNDVIKGGGGDDTIRGGKGNDTAVYAGNKSDYTISKKGDLIYVTNNNSGAKDNLKNIENIKFADQTVCTSDIGKGGNANNDGGNVNNGGGANNGGGNNVNWGGGSNNGGGNVNNGGGANNGGGNNVNWGGGSNNGGGNVNNGGGANNGGGNNVNWGGGANNGGGNVNNGGGANKGDGDVNNGGGDDGGGKPTTMDPIKVENGRIWGDPHFIGADGGKYDVQGEAGKTYNLLSDQGVQVNGRFESNGSQDITVVGAVGITAGGNQITFDKAGTLTINGETVKGDGDFAGGQVSRNKDTITVTAGEYTITIKARGNNMSMDFRSDNAVADNVKPSGLWGVTVDGDGQARNGDTGKGTQGGGAIENAKGEITAKGDKETVKEYEVADLLDTNFQGFDNQFNAGAANANDGGGNANWGGGANNGGGNVNWAGGANNGGGNANWGGGANNGGGNVNWAGGANNGGGNVNWAGGANNGGGNIDWAGGANNGGGQVSWGNNQNGGGVNGGGSNDGGGKVEDMDPIKVENGRIWGDPHFVGADGGKYDVQGEAGKTYNLLSDTNVQVNGRFDQWKSDDSGMTIVGEIGVTTDGHQIAFDKAGDLTIDGEKVSEGEYLGGDVKFEDGKVTIEAGEYTITVEAKGSGDNKWLDIGFSSENAVSDNVQPSGLWGVTVDGDGQARNGDTGKGTQGGGAIENAKGEITAKGDTETVKEYEVGGLFDTNFEGFDNQYSTGKSEGKKESWMQSSNAFNQMNAIGTLNAKGGNDDNAPAQATWFGKK